MKRFNDRFCRVSLHYACGVNGRVSGAPVGLPRIVMKKAMKTSVLAAGVLGMTVLNTSYAGDVKILAAEFRNSGGNSWAVNVTLKHGDTGWDHYADNWRVVDGQGKVLGDRVLYHPHVDEQPFTRGLDAVKVPVGTTTVYVEAHDKEHGWTQKRLTVDLSKAVDGRVRVEAE